MWEYYLVVYIVKCGATITCLVALMHYPMGVRPGYHLADQVGIETVTVSNHVEAPPHMHKFLLSVRERA